MASIFLSRTTAAVGIGLGLGLGLSSLVSPSPFNSKAMQCGYSIPYYRAGLSEATDVGWAADQNEVPLRKRERIRQNSHNSSMARTMRQISLGSVLGLLAGVGLRAFSRALVVLLGVGIVVVEWAASRGYNLLPFNAMQKYTKEVDVQKAMTENMPLKISFAATMILGAFAHL